MRSGWRRLAPRGSASAIAPAAAGAVLIGQSTVDWIWLIPGLTAIGIFCALGRGRPGRRRQAAG